MLALQNLTLRRSARALLENVSVTIHSGQRVGVIGKNGVGKSTLFAAIRGELTPDAGRIDLPKSLSLASVSQETPALDQPALEYALDGDTDLRALEARIAQLEAKVEKDARESDIEALVKAHDRMATIDGYGAKARAAQLLHGLGFAPSEQGNAVKSFSGGWRMRLNLARVLLKRADVLLLDEPTNHLDLDATLWLQEELSTYPGTLLLISHDREFLDAVTTHTLHLERSAATLYVGNYSQFERQRAERMAQQASTHASQQRKVAHLQSFITRFKAKASKAKQAQSRIKALERMELVAAVQADNEFSFEFGAPERAPSPLLRINHGRAGYPGKPLLQHLNLSLNPGDRIALLGANGAGKSTLIKSLSGAQEWLGGEITISPHLSVGYYAQHQLEQLDPKASALLHLRRIASKSVSEQALRDYLGSFAFHGDRQMEAIEPFSGGEKARLALALVAWKRPNLLLLDEPTNHLDLDMRHALELALHDYPGAVLLVSHDRHLVQSCCDTLWRVADGGCETYTGDLDDYARWLRELRRAAQKGSSAPKLSAPKPAAVDDKAQRTALKKLEHHIEKLTDELAKLDAKLADPAMYAADKHAEVSKLTQRQSTAKAELAKSEEEWLQQSEALDSP